MAIEVVVLLLLLLLIIFPGPLLLRDDSVDAQLQLARGRHDAAACVRQRLPVGGERPQRRAPVLRAPRLHSRRLPPALRRRQRRRPQGGAADAT